MYKGCRNLMIKLVIVADITKPKQVHMRLETFRHALSGPSVQHYEFTNYIAYSKDYLNCGIHKRILNEAQNIKR